MDGNAPDPQDPNPNWAGPSWGDSNEPWDQWLQVRNYLWRRYRVDGRNPRGTKQADAAAQNHFAQHDYPPLPDEGTLLFFEGRDWPRNQYRLPFSSGGKINAQGYNNDSRRGQDASARYHELRAYFGEPRYAAQKILGIGGNGLAAHFIDRGPDNADMPGRDIVIKVALGGWKSDMLASEKKMMRVSCLDQRE